MRRPFTAKMRRPFAFIGEDRRYVLSNGTSSHFSTSELACHCGCGAESMDQRTIDVLEAIRGFIGKPIRPVSGVRCLKHNREVGGKPKSQHLPRDFDGVVVESGGAGRAADIVVTDMSPGELYRKLDSAALRLGIIGLGKYPGFVHIDTRDGRKARW